MQPNPFWSTRTISVSAAVLAAASLFPTHVTVQTNIYTDAVGLRQVSLLTNSDTFVSVPFTRVPQFRGLVASVAGSLITVSNTAGWAANQWATPSSPNGYYPYYVVLATGAKAGALYTITNSSASTLDVVLAPEDLSGVVAGIRCGSSRTGHWGRCFPPGGAWWRP